MAIVKNQIERPMCPYSAFFNIPHYRTDMHKRIVEISDTIHNIAEKDGDSLEYISEETRKIEEAIENKFNDRMDLYSDSTGCIMNGKYTIAKMSYFKCRCCGFMMPATMD